MNVPKILGLNGLFIALLLLQSCGNKEEPEATITPVVKETSAESVQEVEIDKPEATYIPSSQIAGTPVEDELIVDSSEVAYDKALSEAEKLVCDDENLPESIEGSSAKLYVCPPNNWQTNACNVVDVSYCRKTESFCRCVLGNDYGDNDFRGHDKWLMKGQNEFTYLSKGE